MIFLVNEVNEIMKPSQLASQLRRIASAIDNSKQPDRNLVARDLKRVLAAVSRTADRIDVLNTVEQIFNKFNIYPPLMKSEGGSKYKGDIDAGWTLEVQEKSDGSLIVLLNGHSIQDVVSAAKAFKSKDPKYLNDAEYGFASGEKILTDAITKSIEELKQKVPQMGKASAQSITVLVGTGPELFPKNVMLDESSWYFYWSGDPSDLIQLYGSTGTGKRDADLVFEFSQQMFTDPEFAEEMNPGNDFVRDAFSAIAEDAYEMVTN